MGESERSGASPEDFTASMSSNEAAELEELRREAAVLRDQLAQVAGAPAGSRSPRDVHQLEARIDSLWPRKYLLFLTPMNPSPAVFFSISSSFAATITS